MFEIKLGNIYDMKSLNDMYCIYNNKLNNRTVWNLIHAILDNYKRTKNKSSNDYPILHVCMNIQRRRAKFKNFWILLDIGCSSMILMGSLTIKTKKILWWNGRPKRVI